MLPAEETDVPAAGRRWGPMALVGILAFGMLGVMAGVGGYTFVYAEGGSYLSDNASACANCHVMQGHFDAWAKSSHHAVATCNDCHTPHDFFGKYMTKARNGLHHSVAFTLGGFHEPIQITETDRQVVEGACRYCHAEVVSAIETHADGPALDCVRCHTDVGHSR